MKIVLDYEPLSGNVYSPIDLKFVGTCLGLEDCELKKEVSYETTATQGKLIYKTMTTGVTADDLIKMREVGLI